MTSNKKISTKNSQLTGRIVRPEKRETMRIEETDLTFCYEWEHFARRPPDGAVT